MGGSAIARRGPLDFVSSCSGQEKPSGYWEFRFQIQMQNTLLIPNGDPLGIARSQIDQEKSNANCEILQWSGEVFWVLRGPEVVRRGPLGFGRFGSGQERSSGYLEVLQWSV